VANEGVRQPDLVAEAARYGFNLEARYDGRFLLTPQTATRDALEVVARAEQFAKSPLVKPNSMRLEWIAPIERR